MYEVSKPPHQPFQRVVWLHPGYTAYHSLATDAQQARGKPADAPIPIRPVNAPAWGNHAV